MAIVAIAPAWIAASPANMPSQAPPEASAATAKGLVVLELFTSQGCSSCPPADRVLSRLGHDAETRDAVVPLAFHVDYWNRAGWLDPFSSAEWTARQETYNRFLRGDGPYTPQLIVNGHTQLNGARGADAVTLIQAEREKPPLVSVRMSATDVRPEAVTVGVEADVLTGVPGGKLRILVAVIENGAVTKIGGGENKGQELHDDFIVRRLATAGAIEASAGARAAEKVVLKLDRKWPLEKLGAVAFVQDIRSWKILGGATLSALSTKQEGLPRNSKQSP